MAVEWLGFAENKDWTSAEWRLGLFEEGRIGFEIPAPGIMVPDLPRVRLMIQGNPKADFLESCKPNLHFADPL